MDVIHVIVTKFDVVLGLNIMYLQKHPTVVIIDDWEECNWNLRGCQLLNINNEGLKTTRNFEILIVKEHIHVICPSLK